MTTTPATPRDALLAHARRLLMERSVPGRIGASIPPLDVPPQEAPPTHLMRDDLPLPEVSEAEVVRYFSTLSQMNFSVDTNFYPLGSCTMKYNPKINEEAAALPGFSALHPLQPEETVQGALKLLWRLQTYLAEITGMAGCSLAPLAGAHGELAGVLMMRAYHHARGDTHRTVMLIPDSAHGTNPASAAMAGFRVVSIPSDKDGNTDLSALREACGPDLAGLMITLPSTLGLFDRHIVEVCDIVHRAGGLVYGDGANMNALLGRVKIGQLGFDVCHLNLHKTFSTPHGGGGPGAGPVCVAQRLLPFLPTPVVQRRDVDGREVYTFTRPSQSIGRLGAFQGNFGVLVRAYTYIRALGAPGLRQVSEDAVLSANYILARLRPLFHLPYERHCMHEVVFSARRQKASGIKALDIAKRLLDFGIHPPTMYFPLIVDEALMIEPTETEGKETLDYFIEVMHRIAREAEENPEVLRSAPHTTPVGRLDEARAARQPDLRWKPTP
ncbi:MAG: aminomethyl-transferring glycine dehydrogenase subunit GcvPB [Dehalococcoidia bacterium]|nr:aminomethyl-transferring glycine dehydrogenase subunit GcvPB [Dehalococcoidia bacterium]MDW8120532.1 aminomethyl-transferring glycine dehydrogenase subunit GcvPB [Chloroflexota bacterium]